MKDWLISTLSNPLFRPLRNQLLKDKIIIFGFHRCVESTPSYVESHDPDFIRHVIRVLRQKRVNILSIRQIVEALSKGVAIPPGSVAFTADDGFWDQSDLCAKIFVEEECPLTIFLITDFLDGKTWPLKLEWLINRIPAGTHDFHYGPSDYAIDCQTADGRKRTFAMFNQLCRQQLGYDSGRMLESLGEQFGISIPDSAPSGLHSMTWSQARQLEKAGIDFGPHSVTHTAIASLSANDARFEIERSWKRLQEELKNPLSVIAWPYGTRSDFGGRDCKIAKEIGLVAALATNNDYGIIPDKPLPFYNFNRLALPTNEKDLMLYTSWIEPLYQLLRKR